MGSLEHQVGLGITRCDWFTCNDVAALPIAKSIKKVLSSHGNGCPQEPMVMVPHSHRQLYDMCMRLFYLDFSAPSKAGLTHSWKEVE